MHEFVASQNLKHFRDLLLTEKDASKRHILADLVVLETKKLDEAVKAKDSRSPPRASNGLTSIGGDC